MNTLFFSIFVCFVLWCFLYLNLERNNLKLHFSLEKCTLSNQVLIAVLVYRFNIQGTRTIRPNRQLTLLSLGYLDKLNLKIRGR